MRAIGVLLCVLALSACRAAPAAPSAAEEHAALLLDLAETVRRAERTADAARYRADRGAAMRAALALSGEALDDVRSSAAELAHALDAADGSARVALLREAVTVALNGADDAGLEVDVLGPLAAADELMERAVATWGERADADLAVQVADLAAGLGPSPVLPPPCRTMWDNRLRWATTVAVRTQLLARPSPDEADRQAFLAEPFGEDRRTADATDRACWREHGALPKALAELRRLVAAYDAAIS